MRVRHALGGVFAHGKLAGEAAEATQPADVVPVPSRRTVIKGGLVAIAGALGWGASAATSGGAGATTVGGVAATKTLTLEGASLRAGSGKAEPGRLAAQGELLGQGGAVLGSFSSTRLAVPVSAGSQTPGAELHSFNLGQGTIFGMGTPPARGESAATYAILGGTGEYAGASGTYLAEQRHLESGGDGTATFTFTFANQAPS